ncbi:MAG: SBBP repeat-containing protein, partial [Planctomycetota bacterium]
AVFSYFHGPRENWKTAIPAFGRIVYPDLWPGIDLVYSGTIKQFKYRFLVRPGADPAQIRLAWRGVSGLTVNDSGELEVATPAGSFKDGVPRAWQILDGKEHPVSMRYALAEAGDRSAFSFGFDLGAYDPAAPLVLDPVVLIYCGYLGGTSPEGKWGGIAVDAAGNAFVAGATFSDETSFPVTAGPDLLFNGNWDAYVAKVNPAGTALLYCGYIGGAATDIGYAIALDASGNAYVTGYTESDAASFPVAVGPDLTQNGAGDAFVARVNPSGTSLGYCGYIGGTGVEYSYGIAVDSSGNAYVTGLTQSDQTSFPVTVGPDLTFNGLQDAFVARVNPSGSALDYCGYIGGIASEVGYAVTADASGKALVTGQTASGQASFPVAVGPDLTFNGGTNDAFVARVNLSGSALDYCGYIGGNAPESGRGIAVDASGNAYVTGWTDSTEASFPVALGPDLTYNGGVHDAFVTRVNAGGTGLDYCGYIGGVLGDRGESIVVDDLGQVFMTGDTFSDESSFPVSIGPDLTFNGANDAFVARVNALGSGLDFCGYIGGASADYGYGIALDILGGIFVTGFANSTEATFPVTVGPDLTFNGAGDSFVARVRADKLILKIAPDPLIAGQVGVFSVTGGDPNTPTWLAYSLAGPGSTYVPPLHVTLGLSHPKKAAGPTNTDSLGWVTWRRRIPRKLVGRNIWLQAAQDGQGSNVVATSVQ